MAFTLAEGLVDAVMDYLEAKLPGKLSALEGEYNDGISLEKPVKWVKGIKTLELIPVGEMPALYAISPIERVKLLQLVPDTTQGVIESMPELALGVVLVDQDAEALQLRLYRYGRALFEVLVEGLASLSDPLKNWILSTNEPWEQDTLSARYSKAEDSPFAGEVTWTIRGWKQETR